VFLEIIKTLKNDGYAIAIISGSFDMAVKQVAKRAGIEHAFGCASIVFDENDMLQDVVTHGDESSAKLALLTELAQSLGVPLSQCACIGDGENDIAMFEATGCGITFRGSPIESSAWRVVDSIDEIPAVIASA
jgi:phosphoserine phosphatase